MISLKTVMAAAANLPPENRDAFLERAYLRIRFGMYTDADVAAAAQTALRGLLQHPASDLGVFVPFGNGMISRSMADTAVH